MNKKIIDLCDCSPTTTTKINEKNLSPECMGGKMVWPSDLGTIRRDSPCTHTVHQNLDTLLYCNFHKMTLRCRRSGKSQRHKFYTHLFLQYYIFRWYSLNTRARQQLVWWNHVHMLCKRSPTRFDQRTGLFDNLCNLDRRNIFLSRSNACVRCCRWNLLQRFCPPMTASTTHD